MLNDGMRCQRDNRLAAQPGAVCSRNSARKKLHPNRKCIPPYHRTVAGDSDLLVEEKFELPRQGYVPGVNTGACRAHVQDQATERFREGAGWNSGLGRQHLARIFSALFHDLFIAIGIQKQ